MRRYTLCLIGIFCTCLLLLTACGGKVAHRPGKLADGDRQTRPRLFTPLEQPGVFPLSRQEALQVIRRLSPAAQGLHSWRDMDFPVTQSLDVARKRPPTALAVDQQGMRLTWKELVISLEKLKELLPGLDARPELLADAFHWLRLGPDFSFTGYYEPTLRAVRTPTPGYPAPLYRLPPDLRQGRPYHSRHAIDRKGALRGKKLEIAWVDDIDAFFLHVQGSGRLLFADGRVTHVLYAGANHHKYVSLGRVMKEAGLLPENGVNMQAIRAYLTRHPQQRAELFDRNPSYVFFREAASGPVGSMGKALTPWVSLAVDRRVVPHASLTVVSVPFPGRDGAHTEAFHGLMLPQDAGGAIKGRRMDIFCGPGAQAEHTAGHLDAQGAVYLLLAR